MIKDPSWQWVGLFWSPIPSDKIIDAEAAAARRAIEIEERDDGLYARRFIDDHLMELGL